MSAGMAAARAACASAGMAASVASAEAGMVAAAGKGGEAVAADLAHTSDRVGAVAVAGDGGEAVEVCIRLMVYHHNCTDMDLTNLDLMDCRVSHCQGMFVLSGFV